MVKVSEALFGRIVQRVEQLVQKRAGAGQATKLTPEDKQYLTAELRVILAQSSSVSNKDLAKLANSVFARRVMGEDAVASNVAPRATQPRGTLSQAKSNSYLPPVPSGSGNACSQSTGPPIPDDDTSRACSRLSDIDGYSRGSRPRDSESRASCLNSRPGRTPINPTPPYEGSMYGESSYGGSGYGSSARRANKLAQGIQNDVAQYLAEKQRNLEKRRFATERHRADLEMQMQEREFQKQAQRDADRRAHEELQKAQEEHEAERMAAVEKKREQFKRLKDDKSNDLQQRNNEKQTRINQELEEDRRAVKKMQQQLVNERQRENERKLANRRKVLDLGSELRDKERDTNMHKKQLILAEREEFYKNLSDIDKKEYRRQEQARQKREAFQKHQAHVDTMADRILQKGNKGWIEMGDAGRERAEQERVKKAMQDETEEAHRKRMQQMEKNRVCLDKQLEEKKLLDMSEKEREQKVHGQLVRHLKLIEEKERQRVVDKRRLEEEHRRTLDQQVHDRRALRDMEVTGGY
eukprot:TRINITY_DN13133_c0_g1_i1.p1 TRINITY_DN13133_c0_g1~~TRINITY_DN13133_c0_g1_i1.p1  ORF type:complete len:546 (+),score=202.37 TRINITY_DN13133_c0_g1_i1:69-1640(+)